MKTSTICLFVPICAILLTGYAYGAEGDNSDDSASGTSLKADNAEQTEDSGKSSAQTLGFEIPPILKPGHPYPGRVKEVQATLNRKLRALEVISNKRAQTTGEPRGLQLPEHFTADIEDEITVLNQSKEKIRLNVYKSWLPSGGDSSSKRVEFKENEQILKVDGVYGQHTHAAVMLFQVAHSLQPTGHVDAVTLDKLEPMIPSKFILARIMEFILDRDFAKYGKEDDEDSKVANNAYLIKRLSALTAFGLLTVVALFAYQVARVFASSTRFLSHWLFTPTSSPWFTALKEHKVFLYSAQFVPAFVFYIGSSIYPSPDPNETNPFPYLNVFQNWHIGVARFGLAFAALTATVIALKVADSFNHVYMAKRDDEDNPISGIVGGAKRITIFVGFLLIVSAVSGHSPLFYVGGIGAFMAVILLLFKDSLLGFVASVNIVMHNLIKKGDWVEIAKYGADGDVTDITLNCIKVQNFDKTITTIPTHALLTEGVKNWSGMKETEGRRIKRSIYIDMHSINVCDASMIDAFKGMELIREYVIRKEMELERYNLDHDSKASVVNSRRLTNIGTFRAYLTAYLSEHPNLRSDMTHLVRQLPPTPEGLPIEIYCFCKETVWADYEAIQADIFDHILSILDEFQLRTFQIVADAPIVIGSEQV